MTSSMKNYVIFGATGSVGVKLSENLAGQGHRVFLAGRNQTKLDNLSKSLDASRISFDAHDIQSIKSVIEKAENELGIIHGVANCVGSLLIKPAHVTSEDEWDSILTINLSAAFHMIKYSIKSMMNTGGSIVLVSSAAGKYGIPNHEAIATAKAGIIGLTLSAAATYANRGIRVNCVAPGFVQSTMTDQMSSNKTTLKSVSQLHPLGIIGQPDNVSSAIEWLLDSRQNWVTGQIIGIDGGLATVQSRPVQNS